jgi:hypothetical protein
VPKEGSALQEQGRRSYRNCNMDDRVKEAPVYRVDFSGRSAKRRYPVIGSQVLPTIHSGEASSLQSSEYGIFFGASSVHDSEDDISYDYDEGSAIEGDVSGRSESTVKTDCSQQTRSDDGSATTNSSSWSSEYDNESRTTTDSGTQRGSSFDQMSEFVTDKSELSSMLCVDKSQSERISALTRNGSVLLSRLSIDKSDLYDSESEKELQLDARNDARNRPATNIQSNQSTDSGQSKDNPIVIEVESDRNFNLAASAKGDVQIRDELKSKASSANKKKKRRHNDHTQGTVSTRHEIHVPRVLDVGSYDDGDLSSIGGRSARDYVRRKAASVQMSVIDEEACIPKGHTNHVEATGMQTDTPHLDEKPGVLGRWSEIEIFFITLITVSVCTLIILIGIMLARKQ